MTDTNRLRALISARGLKLKYVATQLNLTPYGLRKKIENLSEFKASEIATLAEILELSSIERDDIFFASDRD